MTGTESVLPTRAMPPVVSLPAEIDAANADTVAALLVSALLPSAEMVIADMSATTFCGTTGLRTLILTRRQAAAKGTDVRLLLPTPAVLRVLKIHGADTVLPIYPSLEQALA